MGHHVLAQLCVFLLVGCHRSECQPGCPVLWWHETSWSDRIQEVVGQMKTLIFNSYYDDKTDNTPEKKRKQHDSGHCLITLPKGKNFWERKSLRQTANIRNTSATHATKGYVPIVCARQGSIDVQNVSVTILHAPKTVLHHQAEFSRSETQKNGMPMTISGSLPELCITFHLHYISFALHYICI